jgi:acyl-CoA reductase-like NAD-dependent aldehyde dehydrogenase
MESAEEQLTQYKLTIERQQTKISQLSEMLHIKFDTDSLELRKKIYARQAEIEKERQRELSRGEKRDSEKLTQLEYDKDKLTRCIDSFYEFLTNLRQIEEDTNLSLRTAKTALDNFDILGNEGREIILKRYREENSNKPE